MSEVQPRRRTTPENVAPLVVIDDVDVQIPVVKQGKRRIVHAVNSVSIEVAPGETLGLVGESGGGKSTLGRVVAGLRPPTSGRALYDGVDIASLSDRAKRRLRRRIQVVFQDPYSSLDPRMRAGEIIAEPLTIHGIGNRASRRERVLELLDSVDMPASATQRYPSEFSGGQRQRIGIARALAVSPEFLVLDEPISALDISVQAQIMNLLMELRGHLGLTYLFISHDLSAVHHLSDRVAVLYLGSVVEIGPADEIYRQPQHPYTQSLLSAEPRENPADRGRGRILLQGDLPSPEKLPQGCTFHPRCPLYRALGKPETCRTNVPQLAPAPTNGEVACHFAGIGPEAGGSVNSLDLHHQSTREKK